MDRRTFIAAALVAATAAPAAADDARDLARISNYLNAITTLEGKFVQVDPDAVVSQGEFFMRRPGRIRFEYDPPNPALVVADGFWVAVVDQRDGDSDRYPLADTPLNLLLREDVDLRREGAVRRIERADDQLRVTAIDPGRPETGEITMIFSNNPLELRQWVITDAQGAVTTVALDQMRSGVRIDAAKFVIPDSKTGN
jgi:outer membrane lipoprotein-sorting protein